ncbi:adenylyl-sulfate kinase [Vibrio algarum]|uniref:Adenylyl-sulfate kinase n=1 Tax=Vibrio algarum TaxID=3020714 RepID=A0ABT4YLK9_9VIBR|nr:adenylyl-sulfate kinase [Vibrio sp. KJ40-1]MDB1122297.1 adenylyl-sulfate kinase [Vibrio sp. KJ40-1]
MAEKSMSTQENNIVWHQHTVNKETRSKLKKQKPVVLWFTGLSGSGKSTVAGALENVLTELGFHTYLLDGDNVRHGLCKDLSFSEQDRKENIRRVGELCKLMADAGLIVLSAFISPYREERKMVRELLPESDFLEVFVNTPIEVCEQRDPKGLYKKARAGEIKNFTGIDSDYEQPLQPEINLPAGDNEVSVLVDICLTALRQRGVITS